MTFTTYDHGQTKKTHESHETTFGATRNCQTNIGEVEHHLASNRVIHEPWWTHHRMKPPSDGPWNRCFNTRGHLRFGQYHRIVLVRRSNHLHKHWFNINTMGIAGCCSCPVYLFMGSKWPRLVTTSPVYSVSSQMIFNVYRCWYYD